MSERASESMKTDRPDLAVRGRTMSEIKNVVVVGAGAMGSQIGMICALAGVHATVTDIAEPALDKAETELRQRLSRDVEKGRRSQLQVDEAFGRLFFSTDLNRAASTADYVIEAAVEKLDVKRALFADLDRVAPPHAILATNSSSIVSSRIADATGRPDRVCNLHFFNPALIMKCVEVVRGPQTSDDTVEISVALAKRLGKTPVVLEREIPGFIANRILGAVRDEAIYLLENGIASVADIDTACRTALGYPMGPFELMDLTGIDIGYLTKKDRFAESGDPKDQPSKSVSALVERGELGRKTGRGWYDYDQAGTKTPRPTEQVRTP
jgi:3-hydroxybutyryl-CoA dehydrogenase